MAVTRIQIIRSRRIEVHHPFRISCGTRDNFRLGETVNAQMVMQSMTQGGIGFYRKYAPARTNQRGHQQRMPTDIRTYVNGNAPCSQDRTKYLAGLWLVASKEKNVPIDLNARSRKENEPIPDQA
jgi:hypothetical protein